MTARVFGCKREDAQNNFPARLDELSLLVAESSHAHDHVLFDFSLALVQVVSHDFFEGLQESLLLPRTLALFFLHELVSELPKRVQSVNDDVEILVRAYPDEVTS